LPPPSKLHQSLLWNLEGEHGHHVGSSFYLPSVNISNSGQADCRHNTIEYLPNYLPRAPSKPVGTSFFPDRTRETRTRNQGRGKSQTLKKKKKTKEKEKGNPSSTTARLTSFYPAFLHRRHTHASIRTIATIHDSIQSRDAISIIDNVSGD
jgi:hypothetical protein